MTKLENTIAMRAELHAVDEALESGAATSPEAVERELQELALALRAEACEPSPEFGAGLRSRVRAGFPRERRMPRRLPRARMPKVNRRSMTALRRVSTLRRPSLPVLGGVASVLVALTVAVSLLSGGEDGTAGGGEARVPDVQGQDAVRSPRSLESRGQDALRRAPRGIANAKPEASRAAPNLAPEPPDGNRRGFAPGERERRIERSASLTLAAPGDRLDHVADGIVRLTDRYDGFVLRSSLSTGDDGTTGGDFELRIPANRLQSAIGDLSKLADVRARTQSGQDVTPQFVSAEERLQAARAARRSLLRRLERAPTDSAAESIRRRLDLNAGEIRGLRGQVRDLRTRTNYANVTVALQADNGDGGASSPGSGDGLGGAVTDALESLSDSMELAIRAAGVILPLGLLAAGLGVGARALRRRRREAALG